MTLLAFALVIVAAFCHATWNYLVKRVGGGPELVWLFSVVTVVLYLPLAVGIVVVERPAIGFKELAFIVVSAFLHLGYFLLLQRGYRLGDLSLVYPTARSTGPLLSTTAAILIFGEQPTGLALAGGGAIVVGVFFLTGGAGRGAERVGASLLFGVLAGTLIGAYTVWDAHLVRDLLVPPLLLDYASSVTRAVVLSPIAATRRDAVRRHWRDHRWKVIGIAVFNPLAYILVLVALVFTPVSYVAPAREVSVLITVLMGTLLLGEGDTQRRLAWSSLILAGMVLLGLG